MKRVLQKAALACALLTPSLPAAEFMESDVCIFGATPGGIAAAIQASRMGKSVILLEPGKFLGGMTAGGLGATDIGNKAAVGGIGREFYRRIAKHYAQDAAWKLERRDEYFAKRGSGQSKASDLTSADATMWTFEPHVAEQVFRAMLKEARVPVYLEQRLSLVRKKEKRIAEIVMEDASIYRAKIYVDATYEGYVMSRMSVTVGL
jgi:flavin-dependent dehydrogenase